MSRIGIGFIAIADNSDQEGKYVVEISFDPPKHHGRIDSHVRRRILQSFVQSASGGESGAADLTQQMGRGVANGFAPILQCGQENRQKFGRVKIDMPERPRRQKSIFRMGVLQELTKWRRRPIARAAGPISPSEVSAAMLTDAS